MHHRQAVTCMCPHSQALWPYNASLALTGLVVQVKRVLEPDQFR